METTKVPKIGKVFVTNVKMQRCVHLNQKKSVATKLQMVPE